MVRRWYESLFHLGSFAKFKMFAVWLFITDGFPITANAVGDDEGVRERKKSSNEKCTSNFCPTYNGLSLEKERNEQRWSW